MRRCARAQRWCWARWQSKAISTMRNARRRLRAHPRSRAASPRPGAGYFVDYAVSLVPGFVERTRRERLIVDTTLDLDLQAAAERALTAGSRQGRHDARRDAGRAGRDDARRRAAGARRRTLLRRQPVQPRHRLPSASPAPRSSPSSISRRSKTDTARRRSVRRPGHDRELERRTITKGTYEGDDHAGARAGAIRPIPSPCSSPTKSARRGRARRPSAGRLRRRLQRGAVAGARHLGSDAARIGRPATPPSPMAATASSPTPSSVYGPSSGKVLYERKGSGLGRVMSRADERRHDRR